MKRSLAITLFTITALAQVQAREKRIVPVDANQRQSFERQTKVAVLAGVGQYPSLSGLSRLRYPAHDVELLHAVLTGQGYTVVSLKEQEATRGSIEQALKNAAEFADHGQGTVLFFFSGHGFADKSENYLATFEATGSDLAGTGLAVRKVEALLKATGAPRQVMFVDACRNEPGKAVGARSFDRFEASAGLRELLSTKQGRISYEDDQLGSGVFTHFLVRGLKGEAAGLDSLITFRDLADYVTEGVSKFGFQRGQLQVPYEAGESSGDFLLARTSSPVIAPRDPVTSTTVPNQVQSEPTTLKAVPQTSEPPNQTQSDRLEGSEWERDDLPADCSLFQVLCGGRLSFSSGRSCTFSSLRSSSRPPQLGTWNQNGTNVKLDLKANKSDCAISGSLSLSGESASGYLSFKKCFAGSGEVVHLRRTK